MKKQLLEYIIRQCVNEILDNVYEADTVGAPAPPAGGLGTADQPPLPTEPEQQTAPTQKGILVVNPRNPSKPEPPKIPLKLKDDASLERDLYRLAAPMAGPRVMIPSGTIRDVKKNLQYPSTPLFLFVSDTPDVNDPQEVGPEGSDSRYLVASNNMDTVQKFSLGSDSGAAEHPTTAAGEPDPMQQQMKSASGTYGKTDAPDIDEGLRGMLATMVREAIKESRRR